MPRCKIKITGMLLALACFAVVLTLLVAERYAPLEMWRDYIRLRIDIAHDKHIVVNGRKFSLGMSREEVTKRLEGLDYTETYLPGASNGEYLYDTLLWSSIIDLNKATLIFNHYGIIIVCEMDDYDRHGTPVEIPGR